MTEPVAVELEAQVKQVKSMADHTYNLVLNVPEYCLGQIQQIMAWIDDQVRLVVVNEPKNKSGL